MLGIFNPVVIQESEELGLIDNGLHRLCEPFGEFFIGAACGK